MIQTLINRKNLLAISTKEKKQFRAIAHHLKPIVTVGDKGLTTNVTTEVSRALHDHELIKVRISGGRERRQQIVKDLCKKTASDLVQLVGGVGVLYKSSPTPNARLSNLIRHEIIG